MCKHECLQKQHSLTIQQTFHLLTKQLSFCFAVVVVVFTLVMTQLPGSFFLLFIFGCAGSSLCIGFSSCSEPGLLFSVVHKLFVAVASLVEEHRLQAFRFSQLLLPGSREQAQQLYSTGLIALSHVESSRIRDRSNLCALHWQADS